MFQAQQFADFVAKIPKPLVMRRTQRVPQATQPQVTARDARQDDEDSADPDEERERRGPSQKAQSRFVIPVVGPSWIRTLLRKSLKSTRRKIFRLPERAPFQ
jgi:hypothetical protein